jgi:hypothetical protein
MPSQGIMNAKQNRAGSKGQSARWYNLNLGGTTYKIPGAQGFGQHNAAIGSMLSNGIAKQTRKAGGNNVCVFNTLLNGRVQASSACGCQGPGAACPNCWGDKTKCTLSTK